MSKQQEPENGKKVSPQLDAIVVLLNELLQQVSSNKGSMQAAREKAASVLVAGGITGDYAAKLLSMKRQRVAEATKK